MNEASCDDDDGDGDDDGDASDDDGDDDDDDEEGGEGEVATLKSNNPNLKGGEIQKIQKINEK